MLSESDFQKKLEEAFKDLETRIWPLSELHGFEVETGGGMITIVFEEPSPSRFILSPQTAVRQIWLSALIGSYKFDWDETACSFVLDKTREPFLQILSGLLSKQLDSNIRL